MLYKEIYENYLKAGYLDTSLKNLNLYSRIYRENYKRLIPEDKNIKILDIGCGTGDFLFFLKKEGYANFEGVDIGKDQIDFCKRNITEKVRHIEDIRGYLAENPNTFDVITMLNVIEHLPKGEIVDTLKSINNALRKKGRFIVQTVNMANLSCSYNRYIDFTHEVGFTERSLTDILRVADFSRIAVYGQKVPFRFSIKRIFWIFLRKIWFLILRITYLIECGVDSPKIFSTFIIGVAEK